LRSVYKTNNLKGYEIPKLRFSLKLEEEIVNYTIILYGGNPNKRNDNIQNFLNTS